MTRASSATALAGLPACAKREVESGQRQRGGYIFGAFRPATGEAFTHCYEKRNGVNWVDFLERVDQWIAADVGQVYAVLDNLPTHRTTDVLLFTLWHPRWEFVFQPKSAAYLNLIEPWWKVLKSLALKGTRFKTWDKMVAAFAAAQGYWNGHRHPFVWGTPRPPSRRNRGKSPCGYRYALTAAATRPR